MHLRLGVLTRKHGLSGAVRLLPDAPALPELELPVDVLVGYSESFAEPHQLVRFDAASGDPICAFDGVDSPERADQLLDKALFVPAEAVRYTDPFSDPRLAGYQVFDTAERPLGEIIGMLRTPAYFIWTISHDAHEWMLPAIDRFVIGINHESRSVTVDPIPGMYSDEGADDEQHNAQ